MILLLKLRQHEQLGPIRLSRKRRPFPLESEIQVQYKPKSDQNMVTFRSNFFDFTVEAAGIEPASENVPRESLHTCQVPILLSSPGLKEPAT